MDHPTIESIFDDLASSVLASGHDWGTVDRRVWGYARSVPLFYNPDGRGVGTRRDLGPAVRQLRARALVLLNSLPGSDRSKNTYAEAAQRAGPQLSFRPWRPGDADTYRGLLDDPDLWRLLPEDYPGPMDRDTALAWIEHSNGSPRRHVVFAVECDGAVIGQARLQFDSDTDPASAEISYWIGGPFRGRGLGSVLVREFTSSGFAAQEGLNRIFARVLSGNAGSLKVLERARYRREDYAHREHWKDGNWLGEHVLAAYRIDYPESGTPFRRITDRRTLRDRRVGADRRVEVRAGSARRGHRQRRTEYRRKSIPAASTRGRWSTRPTAMHSSRRRRTTV